MSGLRETNEQTMIEAHKAGMSYWKRNKPVAAKRDNLASLARSCGWHDDDNVSWLAGYYGARRREANEAIHIHTGLDVDKLLSE